MKSHSKRRTLSLILALLCACPVFLPLQEANAQRRFGGGGGGWRSAQQQNGGGNGGVGGGRFAGRFRNGGNTAQAAQSSTYNNSSTASSMPSSSGANQSYAWTGPRGGTAQASGSGAYIPGVGAYGTGSASGTTARGGNGSANGNLKYSAITGQGSESASGQINTANGKNYGGSESGTFNNGQGGSGTVQTDNHGNYDVNGQKGQKPMITPE